MDQNVERRIRDRAYRIWEEEGCPEGRDVDHWLRAAQEISAEEHGTEAQGGEAQGGEAEAGEAERGEASGNAETAAAQDGKPKRPRNSRASTKSAGADKAAEPAPAPRTRRSSKTG